MIQALSHSEFVPHIIHTICQNGRSMTLPLTKGRVGEDTKWDEMRDGKGIRSRLSRPFSHFPSLLIASQTTGSWEWREQVTYCKSITISMGEMYRCNPAAPSIHILSNSTFIKTIQKILQNILSTDIGFTAGMKSPCINRLSEMLHTIPWYTVCMFILKLYKCFAKTKKSSRASTVQQHQ